MDKKIDRLLFTARSLCADINWCANINWKRVWLAVLIGYTIGMLAAPFVVYYLILPGGNV